MNEHLLEIRDLKVSFFTPADLLAMPKGCAFAPRCEKCLKICLQEQPPVFPIGEGQPSSCWLHALAQTEEVKAQ